MAKERKVVHVVSNSHWDREWGYPFEETRLLLLDFMDGLLDLLDNDPDFHSFTMDSQVGCVEDYLELRPEKRGHDREAREVGPVHHRAVVHVAGRVHRQRRVAGA